MSASIKHRFSKIYPKICLILIIAQILVFLGSWVWSAAMPESSVRSLLSNGGVRWFFGTFIANIASPLLIWIIILDIAFGMCVYCGLAESLKLLLFSSRQLDSQRKSGLRSTLVLIILEIAIVLLLTVPSHAVLLSVTGSLFPSSFSVSIIPTIAFMGVTSSVCYGLFSGSLHNYGDVAKSACHGGKTLKALLVIYILAAELYYSVAYVLG